MEQNTVFISYRRSISRHLARSIYMDLRNNSWDVFLDVNTIDSGDFDKIILNQIAARAHFVLLISPGVFERCVNPDDWLMREIREAVNLDRNIVPIIEEGTNLDQEFNHLPVEIREVISRKNGLTLYHEYFDEGLQKLRTRFLKSPRHIAVISVSSAEQVEVEKRLRRNFDIPFQPKTTTALTGNSTNTDDSVSGRTGEKSPTERLSRASNIRTSDTDIHNVISTPFEWCRVDAGSFKFGENNETLRLREFYISKFNITFNQFQFFVVSQDGFFDDRWWTGLDVPDYMRQKPGDQQWKIHDHPRENVNWFDAIAFCRWLSFRLGGGYRLSEIETWAVRLPTEFEWEKAARGTDGRIYPYGNVFSRGNGNTNEANIERTMPVGSYPAGSSPYGVMDLSGNVWDWCISSELNPAVDVRRDVLNSGVRRVLRGGSWNSEPVRAQSTFRFVYYPGSRNNKFGFRIVKSN